MRKLAIPALAIALGAIALLHVWPAFDDPVEWTPDALYYQARVLEIRGDDEATALAKTFEGPISADLRARDPEHTGNPDWVAFNQPFYERRVAVPLAAAAAYPLAGERSLLDVSLAGYIAVVLAIFGFLLLRFRLAVAAAVALATAFLPALSHHASFPLTDSWGLALETTAFGAAILTFDRGRRWLALWIVAILLLAFTRDSAWIPILAVGWCAFRLRSRDGAWLFGTGLAAALPALIAFRTPVRDLLAMLVNDSELPSDTSWSFILGHYPGAVVDLVRANGGFLRDGEWYTGLFLVGGVIVLLLSRRTLGARNPTATLMTAGAVLAFLYVLAAPVFSAFRLELVFVPMAAYGIALAADRLLGRVLRRVQAGEHVGEPVKAA